MKKKIKLPDEFGCDDISKRINSSFKTEEYIKSLENLRYKVEKAKPLIEFFINRFRSQLSCDSRSYEQFEEADIQLSEILSSLDKIKNEK